MTYISPFDWRLPCVPILPFLQIDYLDAIGSNIMGCHANMARTPEFLNVRSEIDSPYIAIPYIAIPYIGIPYIGIPYIALLYIATPYMAPRLSPLSNDL